MIFFQKYIFVILTSIGVLFLLLPMMVGHINPFAGTLGVSQVRIANQDYNSYYHAAKRFLESDNIYFADKQVIKFDNEVANAFVYPPLMTFVFVPFSFLSYAISYYLFFIFSVLVFLGALFLLSRRVPHSNSYFWVFLIAYFLSPILVLHLVRGQTDILVLFLVALSFIFFQDKKNILAGVAVGIAASLKLTPMIFLPYFYKKDKKVFWSSIFTIAFFIPWFGLKIWSDFLIKINSFSKIVSSGNLSNSLFGLLYNKYTFNYYSYNAAKIFYVILIMLALLLIFLFIYKNKSLKNHVLLEYAVLSSFMMIVPPVAWVYNGVYSLFLLTAYWSIRFNNSLSKKMYIFFDILVYLIISQPVLSPLIRNFQIYHIFSLRPLFYLCFTALFVYVMHKNKPNNFSISQY